MFRDWDADNSGALLKACLLESVAAWEDFSYTEFLAATFDRTTRNALFGSVSCGFAAVEPNCSLEDGENRLCSS